MWSNDDIKTWLLQMTVSWLVVLPQPESLLPAKAGIMVAICDLIGIRRPCHLHCHPDMNGLCFNLDLRCHPGISYCQGSGMSEPTVLLQLWPCHLRCPLEPYVNQTAMLSWSCPSLALGCLAMPLAGHCSKRPNPDPYRRAGDHIQESWFHLSLRAGESWSRRNGPRGAASALYLKAWSLWPRLTTSNITQAHSWT